MQKKGEQLHQIYGNRVRVRVSGACMFDDMILMVGMRLPGHDDLFWGLPGGGVQFGESVKDALRREFFEETGLRVEVGEMCFVNEFIQPPLHAIEIFFKITSFQGELNVGSDPEFDASDQIIEQVRFMTLDAIQQLPAESSHSVFNGLQNLEELFYRKSF